jgi:hypothetical protein
MFIKKHIAAIIACVIGAFAVSHAALAADEETRTLAKNSYQQHASVLCGAGVVGCFLIFPPTTYTTTLVKSLSCIVPATLGSFVSFQLGGGADDLVGDYIAGSVFESFNTNLVASVNASTYVFYNKGESPIVTAFVSNGGNFYPAPMICTISGEHS